MSTPPGFSSKDTLPPVPRSALLGEQKPLAVRSFGHTDPGKNRENNEDQFLVAELAKAMRIRHSSLPHSKTRYSDERGHLFIVADGMGGHLAGEQASALAVGTIESFILNTLKWFFRLQGPDDPNIIGEFQSALGEADARVFAEAEQHPEWHGMGTTLTMAYALARTLFVVHVGDSRCYLLRGGALRQLTHDHTLVEELVRHGALEPEEAAQHPMRHVIVNAVGGHESGLKVEGHKLMLEPGDRLLLCSDGLTEMVKDDQIAAILAEHSDPEPACQKLIATANAHGGKDNVTVIVANFESI